MQRQKKNTMPAIYLAMFRNKAVIFSTSIWSRLQFFF